MVTLLKGESWLGGKPVLAPVHAQLAFAVVQAVAGGEGAQHAGRQSNDAVFIPRKNAFEFSRSSRVFSPVVNRVVEEGQAGARNETIGVGAMILFTGEAKRGKASGGGVGANRGENEENSHAWSRRT